MSRTVKLQFVVPLEQVGTFIDLLLGEGIKAEIAYNENDPVVAPQTKFHQKGRSCCRSIWDFLYEDKGTGRALIEKHVASLGYNVTSTSPSLARLRRVGFVRQEGNLYFRTKVPYDQAAIKALRG